MSDIVNYYDSFESAQRLEENGHLLHAAIEYWMCTQYGEQCTNPYSCEFHHYCTGTPIPYDDPWEFL